MADNVTNHNLHELAEKLRETADKLSNNRDISETIAVLRNQAMHLDLYQDKLVAPMTLHSVEMLTISKNLENTLKLGEGSFADATLALMKEIEYAQDFIYNNGTDFVQQVATELFDIFEREITTYLTLVVRSVEAEVGRCEPLSNVYKAFIVGGCNRIVDPFVSLITRILMVVSCSTNSFNFCLF